jgi:hypothetical protein
MYEKKTADVDSMAPLGARGSRLVHFVKRSAQVNRQGGKEATRRDEDRGGRCDEKRGNKKD